MGRPKIRWAYYESDSPDDHPGTDYVEEFEEYEEIESGQEPRDTEQGPEELEKPPPKAPPKLPDEPRT